MNLSFLKAIVLSFLSAFTAFCYSGHLNSVLRFRELTSALRIAQQEHDLKAPQLKELKLRKLRELVKFVKKNSPFYSRKFRQDFLCFFVSFVWLTLLVLSLFHVIHLCVCASLGLYAEHKVDEDAADFDITQLPIVTKKMLMDHWLVLALLSLFLFVSCPSPVLFMNCVRRYC